MAPEVELFDKEVAPKYGRVLLVDLANPAPFDPELFGRLGREIGGVPENWDSVSLKYIVLGFKMYVFSPALLHVGVNDILEDMRVEGELNSAGEIRIARQFNGAIGSIEGFSTSLERKLPRSKSFEYREAVMKPVLEPFFNFRR